VTEAEWLASEDPLEMLAFLNVGLEDAKAFLLTAACFRRHWDRLPEAGRAFARLAEAAAEGTAARQDLDDAFDTLEEALNESGPPSEFAALLDLAYGMWQSDQWPVLAGSDRGEDETWRPERRAQADLVRRIFGNPFRVAQGRVENAEPPYLNKNSDSGHDAD
jgi:hypothetical protein